MRKKPTILITTGDPKGIGPEVTEKALRDTRIKNLASFFIIAPDDETGLNAIKKAAEILRKGEADGLVTAPVNKAKINKINVNFRGHTEYLAEATHTKRFAMMFCSTSLKITLVTRHVALKDVASVLSRDKIQDAVELTHHALKRYFKLKRPRIGVCSLNPHCGEDGLIGKEEKDIIIPAIEGIRSKVPDVRGPISSDAIFYMAYKGKFDAVISMYHDQALGPFKMIAFEDGVNVTLGLPFVRTSPDHGTAYDIAGRDIAGPGSMKAAIKLAAQMCSI